MSFIGTFMIVLGWMLLAILLAGVMMTCVAVLSCKHSLWYELIIATGLLIVIATFGITYAIHHDRLKQEITNEVRVDRHRDTRTEH